MKIPKTEQTKRLPSRKKRLPSRLYKRGDWYWYRPRQVDGVRPDGFSLNTKDENEAYDLYLKLEKEQIVRHQPETLGRVVAEYQKDLAKTQTHLRVKSRVHYCWGVNKLVNYFGPEIKTATLTEARMIKFFTESTTTLRSNASKHGLFRALRKFFKWASDPKRRYVKFNPLAKVKLTPLGFKSRRADPFCTIEERNRLIANAPDDDLRFILYMGFGLGLRKLEIMEARRRWFHIEGAESYLEVMQAEGMFLRPGEKRFMIKDSSERSIPIPKDFKAFLKHYLRPDLTPLDFVLKPEVIKRKSEYRVDFTKPFNLYMDSQGLSWVTPHTMRRTFASLLVQSGKTTITKVAIWLGDDIQIAEKKYTFLQKSDDDIDSSWTTSESDPHEIVPVDFKKDQAN